MRGPELVKLYYRIGEVAQIVGVQPHVLRYWESEFRTIRPQKSNKGQRVYSRRDVEKLLRVKDLLRNQGFTIAGARKRLLERSAVESLSAASSPAGATESEPKLLRVVETRADGSSTEGLGATARLSPVPMSPASVSPGSSAVSVSATPAAFLGAQPSSSVVPSALAAVGGSSVGGASVTEASASLHDVSMNRVTQLMSPPDRSAKPMRRALVGLREEILGMLAEVREDSRKPRGSDR